ncbi:hypothetical protein H5410_056363 [Solanum commersonii]|uniref:Uncharacterized protein n=1 Tax=Solanum commersonii TaxID=4109 RepID=A0A9J5WLH9_SOLCO|nr:hypothetical protein H5410_056363 [Solanum commersonii]
MLDLEVNFGKSSDFSYKDSIGVVSADLSHVGLITPLKFKNSGLDGSEYFHLFGDNEKQQLSYDGHNSNT